MAGSVYKILVVEDDTTLQNMLTQKLSKVGYDVVTASDGVEALNTLKKHQPNLILLDIVMPNMNGFDFLEKLRNEQKNQVPVIVISNLEMKADIETAEYLGISSYIIKSDISIEKIISVIEKTLAQK